MSELEDKIVSMQFEGYYNPSLNTVVVHFYKNPKEGEDAVKDIMAYYVPDNGDWDVREVDDEDTSLTENSEVIIVQHTPIKIYKKDSEFDNLVRSGLKKIWDNRSEETREQYKLKYPSDMFEVLGN